jgi:hypothetical protein
MMTANKFPFYWQTNKDWYYWKDGKRYLKDDAPEIAKKSYEAYQEHLKRREELGIDKVDK